MNERIKQIMLDHGLYKYITEDCQHRMEMLAELIVKECIDYCGENLSKTVAGALKIHFGVEE